MNEPAYPFRVSTDALDYQFDSISDQRTIHKLIQFRIFPNQPFMYNMALLDEQVDGSTNDTVISNNHDMPKVLATVVETLRVFFKKYPYKLVYFSGSDANGIRTRLYRIAIVRELEQADTLFQLYGQLADDSFEEFAKDRPYKAFIIQMR